MIASSLGCVVIISGEIDMMLDDTFPHESLRTCLPASSGRDTAAASGMIHIPIARA